MAAKGEVRKVEIDDQEIERPWQESPATVDWSAFPTGYGVLLNERYQFPMDLALWRMKIDRSRQLFVDDYLVAHKQGIVRHTHRSKDHPANPIFDDKSHDMSWHIAPDPEHGYRLYYNSKGSLLHVAYSKDGINWTRPELGVFDLASLERERRNRPKPAMENAKSGFRSSQTGRKPTTPPSWRTDRQCNPSRS